MVAATLIYKAHVTSKWTLLNRILLSGNLLDIPVSS